MTEREEKFTPGPWEEDAGSVRSTRKDLPKDRTWGYGFNDRFICQLEDDEYHNYSDPEELKANAALIAAAPEMYAELKDLLDAMEAGLFPQAAPGVDYPAVMEKKWELRKLLNKARG